VLKFPISAFRGLLFYFYKIKWGGASPLAIPHPVEKFLFKKENDNVCELKGGCPVMEMNGMNERGYKIKGPH